MPAAYWHDGGDRLARFQFGWNQPNETNSRKLKMLGMFSSQK
jgi:hypothetical protein